MKRHTHRHLKMPEVRGICQKRPNNMKRVKLTWKQTWKETQLYEKNWFIWKETYLYKKRPIYAYHLFSSKYTFLHTSHTWKVTRADMWKCLRYTECVKPICMKRNLKRDPILWKETQSYEKRPNHMKFLRYSGCVKKDLYIWYNKEICLYEKRPI